MNRADESEATLTAKAEAAFRQATAKIIERARQTGTPIIVWRDDRVTELSAEEAEALLRNAQPSRDVAQ